MACRPLIAVIILISVTSASQRPNIIIIVADDLGWNDVGFHGSDQIPTPNIDRLARQGIILNNYYVQQMCSPTRSALLTGRYPIHTGLQHGVILGAAPYGLGLEEKLLPQYLNDLGYQSHIVGKWHLGFYAKEYTPTHRGFHSHFGYWLGAGDYWDHTAEGRHEGEWGLDFRRNMELVETEFGQYSTKLFTNESLSIINNHDTRKPMFMYLAHQAVHTANAYQPLEAPPEYVQRVSHIHDKDRRVFAAMLVAMDDSIGAVTKALKDKGMLNNSIIIFTSDNGGPTNHYDYNVASNWPLRGMKNTLWEGGLRVPGFIWSPLLKSPPRVSTQLIHVTDWLPTLLHAIGAPVTNTSRLDGVNQWPALSLNQSSARSEILLNIDRKGRVFAMRIKDFKLIAPDWDNRDRFGWYKPEGMRQYGPFNSPLKFTPHNSDTDFNVNLADVDDLQEHEIIAFLDQISRKYEKNVDKLVIDCGDKPPDAATNCQPHTPCLYHIPSDPCEYHNIYKEQPAVGRMLYSRMLKYNATAVPPKNIPEDPKGFPSNNEGAWRPWVNLEE